MTRNNTGSLTDGERVDLQTLVREAEDITLANARLLAQQRQRLEEKQPNPLYGIIGIGKAGRADGAENHDACLYGDKEH